MAYKPIKHTESPEVAQFRAKARKKEIPFTEEFLYITTKEAGLYGMQKLRLNWSQLQVEKAIAEMEEQRKLVRLAICKSRQVGISTGVSARDFRKAYLNNNTNVVVMAHLDSVTKNLFNMHHKFLYNLPSDIQLPIKRSNKEEMLWTAIASQIIVRTAGSKQSFRSFTPHHLHGSECAFMKDFNDVRQSVETAVPEVLGSSVIYETTSFGAGTDWHRFYEAAEEGETYFRALFLEWFKDPACQLPEFESALVQDEYLEELYGKYPSLKDRAEHFKLTPRQIGYYGWVLRNKYNGDELRMQQEYPCTAKESFLATGTPIFPSQALEKYKHKRYPGKKYLTENANKAQSFEDLKEAEHVVPGKTNYIEIWRPPVPGRKYLISADPSRGVAGGDYSAACIFDIGTVNLVGIIHGRLDLKFFAQLLKRFGTFYNEALLMPEVTGLGAGLLANIHDDYFNIYLQRREDELGVKLTNKRGWETNNSSRLAMVSAARTKFVERMDYKPEAHLPAIVVLNEMATFVQNNMCKPEADKNCHDDLVMAYCMGVKGCLDEIRLNPDLLDTNRDTKESEKNPCLIWTPQDMLKAWRDPQFIPGYEYARKEDDDIGPYLMEGDD